MTDETAIQASSRLGPVDCNASHSSVIQPEWSVHGREIGRPAKAARYERRRLTHFARLTGQAGVVVAYQRLLADGGPVGSARGRPALRCCVLRLRRKIKREPLHPEILLAKIGVGYRLALPTGGFSRRPRDSIPKNQK